MSKKDKLELKGVVTSNVHGLFSVLLENGVSVQCTVSGKIRMNKVKCDIGDKVTVAMSPYDTLRGIIVWRDR